MLPTIFEWGPFAIRGYGLMWVIAILVATYRASRVAKKYGFSKDQIVDIALVTITCGIVGARILDVALHWADYRNNLWSLFAIWNGGLSFFGGFIGGVAGGMLYAHFRKVSFWNGTDLYAPSLALGYAIARIGCFLSGCCYGCPTNLPWGIRFHAEHQPPGILTPPSHPTQIYAFLAGLVIYAVLVQIERRRRFPGQVFSSFLVLYGIYRFCIEFLRAGVTSAVWQWGLTYGHVAALALVIAGVVLYAWRSRQTRPTQAPIIL